MGKTLVCHNNKSACKDSEETGLTIGKEYDVVSESDYGFHIINDDGQEISFTREPDEDGHSYKDWLTLKTDMIYINVTTIIGDYTTITSIPVKKDKGLLVVKDGNLYKVLNGKKVLLLVSDYNIGTIVKLDYNNNTYELLFASNNFKDTFGGCEFLSRYKAGEVNYFDKDFFSSTSEREFANYAKGGAK